MTHSTKSQPAALYPTPCEKPYWTTQLKPSLSLTLVPTNRHKCPQTLRNQCISLYGTTRVNKIWTLQIALASAGRQRFITKPLRYATAHKIQKKLNGMDSRSRGKLPQHLRTVKNSFIKRNITASHYHLALSRCQQTTPAYENVPPAPNTLILPIL